MIGPDTHTQYKLNISKWVEFCFQVKVDRAKAARTLAEDRKEAKIKGFTFIPWGIPYGGLSTAQRKKELDLTQFGMTTAFWEQRLDQAKKHKPKDVSNPPHWIHHGYPV